MPFASSYQRYSADGKEATIIAMLIKSILLLIVFILSFSIFRILKHVVQLKSIDMVDRYANNIGSSHRQSRVLDERLRIMINLE